MPSTTRRRPGLALLWMAIVILLAVELLLANATLNAPRPGSDFVEFWTAAKIGLAGHAASAYDPSLLLQAEKLVLPAVRESTPWFYPPPFYLLVLPLALLPYVASYWAFMLTTLGAYVFVLRRVVQSGTAMGCLAAFSGLWINLLYGQNGFLTASFAGAALLLLPRKPVLAGIFVGLLVIKPQLALLFPLALLAIGAWRALASAALTAAAFLGVSTAWLGVASLRASLAGSAYARHLLQTGVCEDKMPTVFAFVRALGAPLAVAYALHALLAALAAFTVWRVWRRCPDWQLRGAALMTGTFLISPYAMVYDLVWLALPIAWLVLVGLRLGWLGGERAVLIAAWLLPLVLSPLATHLHLRLGPWVLCTLLWTAARKAGVLWKTAPTKRPLPHLTPSRTFVTPLPPNS